MASINQVFAERGIDVKREIRKLKQRTRYAQHLDRPKFFAGDRVPSFYFYGNCVSTQKDVDLAEAVLIAATDIEAYVKAWSLLNHLKAC